jgi:hypothetical protein
MAKIDITDEVSGALSETYFKQYCNQNGWAYISLEQINENKIKGNVLKFRKGFKRILVQLPEEIIKEVEQISKPSNSSILRPSYVYDFLLCRVEQTFKDSDIIKKKNFKDFRWAEVKTGYSRLTKRQIRISKEITIPLYRYRVPNTKSTLPEKVDVYWDLVDKKFLSDHGYDY